MIDGSHGCCLAFICDLEEWTTGISRLLDSLVWLERWDCMADKMQVVPERTFIGKWWRGRGGDPCVEDSDSSLVVQFLLGWYMFPEPKREAAIGIQDMQLWLCCFLAMYVQEQSEWLN